MLMLKLIEKFKDKLKISFSITGTALEQLTQFNPEVIELFQNLYKSESVEFIAESYYHSLAFLFSPEEFRQQVKKHKNIIKNLFGENPVTFRNTELAYSNDIALEAKNMGFKNLLAEGADSIFKQLCNYYKDDNININYNFPHKLYCPKDLKDINLLLRDYKLSDDIAFRFSDKRWKQYPLTVKKYVKWLSDAVFKDKKSGSGEKEEIINLFMDYETFGEHQSAETGIFDFFEKLISAIINKTDFEFIMPREISQKLKPAEEIDVPDNISWADRERDLSAWTGNSMQKSALNMIYKIENDVKNLADKDITDVWRKLQTSDHFYYMSTKGFLDGNVHKYFNYFATPYDAYIVYSNIVNDLYETIKKRL